MINLLLGPSGGGKSFEAVVYHIIPALEKGRQVITNLPLNIEHFRAVLGDDKADLIKLVKPSAQNPIPFKTLADFGDPWRMAGKNPIGSLYVIDECHKPFPLRQVNTSVEEWFAEHRHELADVLLITQSYGKIWKSIRDNVQIVYRVRKNIALGAPKSYVKKVQDGVRGEVVNTTIRVYDSKYYHFYNSHTLSDTSAKEANANDIKPLWQHWTFMLGLPLLVFGLYRLFSSPLPFSPHAAPIIKPPVVSTTQASTQKATAITPQQMQSKTKDEDKIAASHPYYKLQMHIGGYIESSDKTRFLYNVLLSQNGQLVSTVTDKELTMAGYTVEPKGACLFKVKFEHFYDYITCDLPQTSSNPSNNFKSTPPSVSGDEGGTRSRGVSSSPQSVATN